MCYSRGAHDLGGALKCPSAGAWRCFVQVRVTCLGWQPSQVAAIHRLGAGGAGFHQVSECWGLTVICTGAVLFWNGNRAAANSGVTGLVALLALLLVALLLVALLFVAQLLVALHLVLLLPPSCCNQGRVCVASLTGVQKRDVGGAECRRWRWCRSWSG